MGAFSNPERRESDDQLLAQFSAGMSHPPGPATGDGQHGKAMGQVPALVRAWIQDAVTEKEAVLRATFQAVAEPLFLLDRERKILVANEAAAQQLGREAQELTGVAMSECLAALVPADVCEQRMVQITEVLRGAAPARFTDESAGLAYENVVYPVMGSGGEVAAVIVSIRDVTECGRTRKEPQGSDASTQRTEQLASLGMVGAALAHELAQPLSVARLAVQNAMAELERLTCPDIVKHDLEAGLAACARIGEIIGRFRDLARPPRKARETEVRVAQVAERTFRLLEQSARQARMTFRTENLDALPAVPMRANELDDLFLALVQNAVQAADGTRDRRLLITGAVQGDALVLRFEDNCGGIEPTHLARIFEPFFTTKPSHKGVGLGLCIARRIVCQRGGQIAVESRYGESTTFTVTLPREPSPGTGGQYVP